MPQKYLITIVGPTAIGKTILSIHIAKHFKTSVISCDSRQFYREMTIGTAIPSKEELAKVPHYFIQSRSIFEDYNVHKFEKDALKKLNELFITNNIVVMVGGSGLYADALLEGLDYFPDISTEIRTKVNKDLEKKGLAYLQRQLKKLDTEAYESIAIDNPRRLIRALEVCIASGETYSSFKNKPQKKRNFKPIKIGLTADRKIIYNLINKRVDLMIKKGLTEEAKNIYPHKKLNCLQTVGYRELFSYFDGLFTLDFAIEEIKKNTRRFAKRQITWFKKDPQIRWFDYSYDKQKIIEIVQQKITENDKNIPIY